MPNNKSNRDSVDETLNESTVRLGHKYIKEIEDGPLGIKLMNKKPQILVVDDQLEITEFLEMYLDDLGIIRMANSGPEALSIIETLQFDLIISDINMRPMTGIEFGNEVRKLFLFTPIIFFSGEVNGELRYKHDLDVIGNSHFVDKNYQALRSIASIIIFQSDIVF
ncbi:MAG: response regulator [Bacteriovoracaceae bacterium]|nr:response regulator [Bacteriovoracaceae bacterium]